MVHAKNYETVSTLVKVMQKKPWPLFFWTQCRWPVTGILAVLITNGLTIKLQSTKIFFTRKHGKNTNQWL